MDTNEIISKVAKVKSSTIRSKLTTRWDDDLNLYLLNTHSMKGVGKMKDVVLPGVYNVTSADPQTYLDRVTAIIAKAEPRLKVISSLKDNQIETIVNWWRCVLYNANQYYQGCANVPIYPTLAFLANLRGYAAARSLIFKQDGKTIFEILPLDVYDLYWKKYGPKLSWACIVTLLKEKESIKAEFGIDIDGDASDTHDYYDDKGNEEIVVGTKKVSRPRTYVKQVPISIHPVVTTPMVSGTNTSRYTMEGESLYKAVRQTIKERNDILSIIKTHAMLGMRPPLVHTSDGTTDREVNEYPAEWGTVMEQMADEKFDSLKFADMANTNAMLFNMVDGEYQRGTVPNNEYGGLNFQLSALALDTLSGQRGVVFLPRQTTLENLYKSIFDQMLNQFIDGSFDVAMIDESGKTIAISSADLIPLRDKFRVDFTVDVESPEQESSNFQKAVMAINAHMPDDFIVRDVFKSEDPEKLLAKMDDERLLRELPELRLTRAYDRAMKDASLLTGDEKEAKLTEAKLLKARIEQLIQQMTQQPAAPGGQ
jgi:hypothetical protein